MMCAIRLEENLRGTFILISAIQLQMLKSILVTFLRNIIWCAIL